MIFNSAGSTHTAAGNVIEVNAYYPYGKIIQSLSTSSTYGKNNYKYNGKELQTELELGWLDYGARPLPTSHPVWFVPDPLAEWSYNKSPYTYSSNNPINRIDPDGRFDTKFGAWLYKLFNGGEIKQNDKGKYYVQSGYDEGAGGGAGVRAVDRWGKKEKSSSMEGRGGTQRGGTIYYMGSGGVSPTKQKATEGFDMLNVEDLLAAFNRSAGPLSTGSLSVAEGINSIRELIEHKQSEKEDDSDKTVKESTGDKTDINGKLVEKRIINGKEVNYRDYHVKYNNDKTLMYETDPFTGDTIFEWKKEGTYSPTNKRFSKTSR